mmetsp:Transcript_14155/g.21165  ORF Transcript_14155/g.21165 Transcript_14155/m.21165 type:complete len:90 (-) Transcript_14155:38-307(-)
MHWQTLIEAKSLWNRIETFSIDVHQIKLILGQRDLVGKGKNLPFPRKIIRVKMKIFIRIIVTSSYHTAMFRIILPLVYGTTSSEHPLPP